MRIGSMTAAAFTFAPPIDSMRWRRSAGRLRDDGANLRALLKRRRRRRSAPMRQRARPDAACAVARLSRTETQVKHTEHRG